MDAGVEMDRDPISPPQWLTGLRFLFNVKVEGFAVADPRVSIIGRGQFGNFWRGETPVGD